MTSTDTITTAEVATGSAASVPRHSNSMKSTWRHGDKSTWNHAEWALESFGIQASVQKPPVFQKTDKMPYMPHAETHKWILAHGLWPLVVHQIFVTLTGKSLPIAAAFIFYALAFNANAIHQIHRMRDLGNEYGYLDGDKHERDEVPDGKAEGVLRALLATATIRPIVSVFLSFRASQTPFSTFSWWLPLELALYGIILDFWFYWYHRCMHDNDALWKYHRTHHLTKHPSPLLTLYADHAQEVFDIIGIPILTYATMRLIGLPMPFADWWLCQQYIVWTELWGHSGLRIFVTPPTPATPFLHVMNAELTTEDHDLHHRKGWKKSHNYGKQTLLWDRIFGTCHPRIEAVDENIAWDRPAMLPLW